MEGGVVDSTIKQFSTGKLAVLILALVAALAIVLPAGNSAYAADNDAAPLGAGSVETSSLMGYGSTVSAVPSNKSSYYDVYSTYMFVNAGPNACAGCNLYVQWKPYGAKTWKSYGPMYSYNNYTITGLRPNTWYYVRMVYKSIYTSAVGKPSKAVFVKTGPKTKLPIKSVSVKAVNLSKHRATYYGYYTGLPLGKYTYYTYKIRVTVKLKSVPKANAVCVNGHKFKCNRKTYTYTTNKLVRYYNTPRGKAYSVAAYSYLSNNFGGYSLLYKKNYKIR